jgi:hypothetical protein
MSYDTLLAPQLYGLSTFFGTLLHQLPFVIPHDEDSLLDFLRYYRQQKKNNTLQQVRLADPDWGSDPAPLRQVLRELNPRCREILRGGRRYLERYYLFKSKELDFTLDVHRFLASDDPCMLHCHPWEWAVSIILSGTCTEHMLFNQSSHTIVCLPKQPGTVSLLTENTYHRIEIPPNEEVWTLFMHPVRRCGGFSFLQQSRTERAFLDGHSMPVSRLMPMDEGNGAYTQNNFRYTSPSTREVWQKNSEL